jgi:L-asparaginase II
VITAAGPRTLVRVTRRDTAAGRSVEESSHAGHLVVVDRDGAPLVGLGDPDELTFVRSTAKPFQAAACLELLEVGAGAGPTRGAPSPPETAVAWASHRGERDHLVAVERLLARSGLEADDLTCPPSTSEDDPCAGVSRLRHNCSGKHALFALAGARQGTDRSRLLDPDGPLQRVVLRGVAEALGPALATGVDGCGAPAVAVPLCGLARGFASLAVDDRWATVRRAGHSHPNLVGGEGRLETALLAAGVVAKVGAEGVFAAGWRDEAGAARGLAVKVSDGAARGATTATAGLLGELGLLPAGAWRPEPVLGGGAPAGEVAAAPDVHALADRLATG